MPAIAVARCCAVKIDGPRRLAVVVGALWFVKMVGRTTAAVGPRRVVVVVDTRSDVDTRHLTRSVIVHIIKAT